MNVLSPLLKARDVQPREPGACEVCPPPRTALTGTVPLGPPDLCWEMLQAIGVASAGGKEQLLFLPLLLFLGSADKPGSVCPAPVVPVRLSAAS